jgi:hypothetical protein
MSTLANMLCGLTETTMAGDVAPVMASPPGLVNPALAARRKIPTDPKKKKDMRSRMAQRLIGEDSRDGYVIPDDAKEVDQLEVTGDGLTTIKTPNLPGEKPKNPYSGEEPLILPAASLVAPDVTPEALYPLDPSQIPGADAGKAPEASPVAQPMTPPAFGAAPPSQPSSSSPAIDVVLGKTAQSGAAPAPPLESLMSKLPGVPSPAALALSESTPVSGEALSGQGQPMPEHKSTSGGAWKAFLKLAPIPARQLNG